MFCGSEGKQNSAECVGGRETGGYGPDVTPKPMQVLSYFLFAFVFKMRCLFPECQTYFVVLVVAWSILEIVHTPPLHRLTVMIVKGTV